MNYKKFDGYYVSLVNNVPNTSKCYGPKNEDDEDSRFVIDTQFPFTLE